MSATRAALLAEDVQVDIGALANVPRHDAADEARPERTQKPHHVEGGQRMSAQVLSAAVALVNAGEDLDLLANFGVGGEIAGLDVAAAQPLGRLAFGGKVFGLGARTSGERLRGRSRNAA